MTATDDRLDVLMEQAERLPPGQRAAFSAWAHQEITRLRSARQWPSAGKLAMALDSKVKQTADLAMIDDALEWAFTTPAARLMISKPSQTGKSDRVVKWGVTRALQLHPDWRIIIATHSEDLARTHSEEIRTVLKTYGTGARDASTGIPLPDRLGIGIGHKKASTRWSLAGHRGGIFACGVGTALPGRPTDCLVLDDLYADMMHADSPAVRRRVNLWWDSVASQRPGPEAPIIFVGTRWNEQDAHAYLMAQEPGRWRVLNFPAIAEVGTFDSLHREPGLPLQNPRGHTDWEALRAIKPARVWSAMYQGNPTPAEGALFNQAWFDDWRLADEPPLYRRIVGVDPAETGQGDEAGIIAGGVADDGTVVLTDDWSGHFSSAQWPRRACLLALRTGATELIFEAYSSATTYDGLLRRAYTDLAVEAAANGGAVEGIAVPEVRPFHIFKWQREGNALIRSTGFRHATSTGRCRMLGYRLATMEAHAVRWFENQHQPDRLAGGTIVFDVLAGGEGVQISAPRPEGWGDVPSGLLPGR